MAFLFPSIENINNLKVKPTEGESYLLNFLINNLNDKYEIYFQPWINGDNPDIVVMKKNSGVMIFEVKDWHLKHYSLDNKKNWVLKSNGTVIKSPLSQLLNYKNNLFELHIEDLYKKFINDKKMFSIVNLCVYFHNANINEINIFLKNGFESDKNYMNQLSYYDLWGNNSLNTQNLQSMLEKRWMVRKSKYFEVELYDSFKRYLQPTEHTIEQARLIEYNKEQLELINSNLKEQKIKGIAGSGKTMVLAKKAVNAHIDTKETVLILCYNIALRNYLHDKISEVRENFDWSFFHINSYHDFISQQMNNYNLQMSLPDDFDYWNKDQREDFFSSYFSDPNLFEIVKNQVKKYSSIFVDETQDFTVEWLNILKKYFLNENGNYVLFADEKQNVYNNPLEIDINNENDRKPKTNVRGRWNESLKKSFRLSKRISHIANQFQNEFFENKYYLDNIEIQQDSLFRNEIVKYYKFENNVQSKQVSNLILSEIKNKGMHSNDVCILSFKIDEVVEIDHELRIQSKEKTKTTVENLETKIFLKEQIKNEIKSNLIKKLPGIAEIELNRRIEIESGKKLERELEKIRKNKRFQFRMNPGMMKLSTIHSFKGWEINTLFLIIEKDSEFQTEELIYTGLTRCRNNLIVLNKGNNKYHNFFSKMDVDN